MWFIREDVLRSLERYCESTIVSEDERVSFEARRGQAPELRIEGGVATINVEGVLTPKPDIWAWLFGAGNTTYEQIQAQLAAADRDSTVQSVQMNVDSPGGHVDGLFDTIVALQSFTKPIEVRAACACSAAYAIAAAAGPITAQNEGSQFGSVGVVASFLTRDSITEVTSTQAPDKRPDPTTAAGKKVIRGHLDALHDLMVDAIAVGRDSTAKKVNADFGRGAVLTANEAIDRGMVDAIGNKLLRVGETPARQAAAAKGGAGTQQQKEVKMTKEQLKAQHPELYAAVCDETLAEERDRVGAHLEFGQKSGDMKTAIEAIKSGDGMTQTLIAKYMTATANRAETTARQADSDSAAEVADGADPEAADTAPTEDLGDKIVARMENGRKPKAPATQPASA